MIEELDTVVLKKDVPSAGLQTGDVGAVVHCHAGDAAYEVEFVTADGKTIALLTLCAGEIRSTQGSEILHVRELAAS